MRLLHVYSGNLFGGVERMLVTLASTAPPGLSHEFALTSAGQLRDELERAGARLSMLGDVRVRRPDSVLRARLALRTLLAARPVDAMICHSAWSQALFAAEARRAGVRQVFWLHDAANGSHWIERLASRQLPDLAVANSEFTRSTLALLYRACASTVIHCPAPAPAADADARDRVRAELGATSGETVILQAARLQEWKGQRVLMEALNPLTRRGDWTCWIAGSATNEDDRRYESELRALAPKGRVRFLGHRTDVANLMAASDIFCQPNTRPEPFGISLVEALWAGLPVVTSAAGGALEVVTPSTGRLVAPGDSGALTAALHELIADPALRSRLGRGGPARAKQISDPAACQARIAAIARPARKEAA